MPALATHWLFARDALNRHSCPPALKRQIAIVSLGAQGPDPLFFHRRIPWRWRKRSSHDLRSFASACHAGNPRNWLLPPLHFASLPTNPEREKLCALVYGFFLHYHLDRIVHPYVFSKSGFDETGELSPPWNARHAWFETLLDFAVLEQRGVHIQAIRPWCMMNLPTMDLLLLDNALSRVFPEQLDEGQYREACSDMQAVYHLLHDPFGWKRTVIEKMGKNDTLMAAFVAPQSLSKDLRESVLGLGGDPWPDPVSGEERRESFGELYAKALEELDILNGLWDEEINRSAISTSLDSWIGTQNHDGCQEGVTRHFHAEIPGTSPYSPEADGSV